MSELSSFFYKKNKIESHKKVSEKKIFCNIIIPSEDAKILEFNHHQKSSNPPFIIYPDAECIIAKIDRCKNNSEYLATILHQVFQCLQYLHLEAYLEAYKISMVHTEIKIVS